MTCAVGRQKCLQHQKGCFYITPADMGGLLLSTSAGSWSTSWIGFQFRSPKRPHFKKTRGIVLEGCPVDWGVQLNGPPCSRAAPRSQLTTGPASGVTPRQIWTCDLGGEQYGHSVGHRPCTPPTGDAAADLVLTGPERNQGHTPRALD